MLLDGMPLFPQNISTIRFVETSEATVIAIYRATGC